jgi:toxin ParE1/3/4
MRLSFHPLVQREVNEAISWYEDRKVGLGDDFFEKFSMLLAQVSTTPELYGYWLGSKRIRRAKMKRFPYAVLFELMPGKVRVLCLRHNKRHPSYGIRR